MKTRNAVQLVVIAALAFVPAISRADGRYDGNWTTHMACEAHGETPAYKWVFSSIIKDGVFHGQHGEKGGAGYLVVDGKIADDGSAKLSAKGTVESENNHARGVFALKGNNYDYVIKAQFMDTKGSGTRNEGAGILGRPCTFDFEKQTDAGSAAPAGAQPITK